MRPQFDEGYYRRFYDTLPVHTATEVGHLAAGVTGLCDWWGIPLRTVLDVGAGPAYWREWLAAHRPQVRYRGVDISRHACAVYGHERRNIADWRPRHPADLVVCQGVLQYLEDEATVRAVSNLAAATRHILYLEVPTRRDKSSVLDLGVTDLDCHWRSGAWYRRLLEEHFVAVGAGLWGRRGGAVPFYEMERSR